MLTRGVRLVLPPRRVRHQRAIGLGIAGVCVGVIALAALFSVGWWWTPMKSLLQGGAPRPGLIGLLIPALAMLVVARGVRFGLLIAFGHAEVEIDHRRVAGIQRCGPVRTRVSVPIGTIERVIVEPGLGARKGKPDTAFGKDLANLVLDRSHNDPDKRKVGLAHAYPRALIDALAADLGDRLSLPVVVEEPERLADRLDRRKTGAGVSAPHRVPRPKRATGALSRTEHGISVVLPAMGYFKGSKGLGSFSLLWLGFIAIFTAFWIASMFGSGGSLVDVFPLLICGLFWLVGFGMVYGAARSGRRRGLIDATGRELVITRQSIGKPRVEGWNTEEIARVVIGPSGTEINDKPVMELQVHLSDGSKRGFFPERRDDELRWLAGEIAHAMGLGDDAGNTDG